MAYTPPSPYGPASGGVAYSSGLQLVNEVLTNLAKQFAPDGFLYEQIISPQQVDFNMGEYPVFDPSTFFSLGGNLEVADDAETPIVDFNWSVDYYHARDRRLSTRLTRKEENQSHAALRLEYSKTRNLLSIVANNREWRLASILRAQANGGQFTNPAITPAVKWDAGTTGSPATIQADVQNAVLLAVKACGKKPNTIVFDQEVAMAIANDPTVKTQLQYRVGPEMLAAGVGILPPKLFGLNVMVAEGPMYNTARPGQSASLAATWGQSARVIYCDPAAQWGVPATAYGFRGRVLGGDAQAPSMMNPVSDGSQEPGPASGWAVVDRFWTVDPPAQRIRTWECVDEKCVAPELAVEIQNVLSGSQYEY